MHLHRFRIPFPGFRGGNSEKQHEAESCFWPHDLGEGEREREREEEEEEARGKEEGRLPEWERASEKGEEEKTRNAVSLFLY